MVQRASSTEEKIRTVQERLIGRYDSGHRGPLFICIGAMHGNEPAGVRAIELALKMLDVEHIKNPEFTYKGRFTGIIGNLKAFNVDKRFMVKDLNRQFFKENIDRIRGSDTLDPEDLELLDLLAFIEAEIAEYNPDKLIILDLHTTSSFGGIFTICQDDPKLIETAKGLHAPIVLGITEGLIGTTLHYFTSENMNVDTTAITFESGQHVEDKSVNRAIAGIICMMRELGAVKPEDVENYHEQILISYSKDLPQLTKLSEHYPIADGDHYVMIPGYKNFQNINQGELLAHNNGMEVRAATSGLMLMPLYQSQGEDGYFIVNEIKTT